MRLIRPLLLVLISIAGTAAPAHAALPSVEVDAVTVPMPNTGSHRGIAVTSACPGGSRLVGGGGYLRTISDPTLPSAPLPTNGLVLGGVSPSTGATPVDVGVADGTPNPSSWMTVSRYTGQSQDGNQASTFALCATGVPADTVVETATTTGPNATQQVSTPNITTATCGPGTRLIGGGAQARNGGQVDDGTTTSAGGNLKPLASFPSDAAGVEAPDGSTTADSWSAYGSAGIPMAADTVIAYALCSTDPATPPIEVDRVAVDGPAGQPGTTTITATATCPAGTRMLGGGYRVDQTATQSGGGVVVGAQPQQGYHMRGSFPGTFATPSVDAEANASSWTSLVQAGGQNLPAGDVMTNRAFAMCATVSAPATAVTGGTGSVTTTGARPTGTINPGGTTTSYVFEYGTTTDFGSITTPDTAGNGTSDVPVAATISGLAPNTTYRYRLVATNLDGTTTGLVGLFTTGPGGAPVVDTGDAQAVTASGATLPGSVDALGKPTAFTFEYGTTTAFGSITAVDLASAVAGAQAVSLPVTGLAPDTTYLYRLVAGSEDGTTAGPVKSFTTGPAA